MVSKVTQQFNGAPIPTFIYTNDTVRAICVKASLPEQLHVSFLNEYGCVLEFLTEFKLNKFAMNLQQITQWFGYDVVITCEVVTKDKLNKIEQVKEEPQPSHRRQAMRNSYHNAVEAMIARTGFFPKAASV